MKCPRCSASFTGAPDEHGFFLCPKCGAKLRTRPAAAPPGPANPRDTLPPDTPLKPIPRPGEPPASLDIVLAEVRAVRRIQEDMLGLLRTVPEADRQPFESMYDDDGPSFPEPVPTVRARRRKTVLLIDDDEATRRAALAALEVAEVPSRGVADGALGLQAIAAEKPDVIVLELAVGGSMAGKDVINMIKATMEWVDIPIVLYTRLPIESQKEARTIHGADELVPKAQGSAETLVQRVIQIFRRG